jgi:hypothetical protein
MLGDDMPRAASAWCATALLSRLLSGSPSAPPVPAISARLLAASRCNDPCLHEEVAAPAGPVAAQIRSKHVAGTRREKQEPSSPRSLVRRVLAVFATVNT